MDVAHSSDSSTPALPTDQDWRPAAAGVGHRTIGGQQSADAATADLWYPRYLARGGNTPRTLADLEDAVFRSYLPMARTLANQASGSPSTKIRLSMPPNSA